jgi:hypothetical protein
LDVDALRTSGLSFVESPEMEPVRNLFQEILGSDLTLELEPRPGAVDVMRRLARDHELMIVTARNDAEAVLAQRWLARQGIEVHDFISTARGPKSTIAREQRLSVLLDDMTHNFVDFHELETVGALYRDGWDRYLEPPDHVRSIEHWHRFEELVDELASGLRPAEVDAAGA